MRKIVTFKLLLCLILITFLAVDYTSGENKENIITWDKTFGGSGGDMGFSIIHTENGGYAVSGYAILDREKKKDTWRAKLGYIELTEEKRQDIWIIKLGENGNKEWEKTFDGDKNDVAYSIVQTEDGNFITTGCVWSKGAGRGGIYVVKLNKRGDLVWDRTFGGSENDEACSIIQTDDEGYAVAGWTKSKGTGNSDVWVLKLDENGNL